MAVNVANVQGLLKKQLEAEEIELIDERGDASHLYLTIKSPLFKGQSKINCHKLIYKVLSDYMADIHALSIKIIP